MSNDLATSQLRGFFVIFGPVRRQKVRSGPVRSGRTLASHKKQPFLDREIWKYDTDVDVATLRTCLSMMSN